MKTLIKVLSIIALLTFGLFLGVYLTNQFSLFKKEKVESSTIVLEKIKQVTKLITVEGNISELYSYKDYYSYDFSPFRKKALIRVNAKVSAGYDFDKMQINVRPDKRLIEINNFPNAEILSIDHDLDYYDLTEGVFNSFEPEDLNKLNDEAKTKIENAARESDLLQKAESQKQDLMEMLELLLDGTGYELKVTTTSQPLIG